MYFTFDKVLKKLLHHRNNLLFLRITV